MHHRKAALLILSKENLLDLLKRNRVKCVALHPPNCAKLKNLEQDLS